jgi:hypothetical protein
MKELVEKARQLFTDGRGFEDAHDIRSARKFERKIARIVARVAKDAPSSKEHIDVLQTHEYMLLSLSRTSERPETQKKYRDRAYDCGSQAVDMLASHPIELGSCFSAYNLGIDLVCSENRPKDGLKYLKKSLRWAGKLKGDEAAVRWERDFHLNYGIAKAYFDLGEPAKARKVLSRRLKSVKLKKLRRKWSDLRGVAKCAELLGQIELDIVSAKQAKKNAKATAKNDAKAK